MKTKKLSEITWNDSYMGLKNIKVNGLPYTVSGRRDSVSRLIVMSYSLIGCSFEIYFAWNCEYDYVMSEIRKMIKSGKYAIGYYCDHKEYGELYDCICF